MYRRFIIATLLLAITLSISTKQHISYVEAIDSSVCAFGEECNTRDTTLATLTLDESSIMPGDTIVCTYELRNPGESFYVLNFATSQKYDIVLFRNSVPVYRWSDGKSFSSAGSNTTISPSGTFLLNADWTIPSTIEPGMYDVVFVLSSMQSSNFCAIAPLIVRNASKNDVGLLFMTDHIQYITGSNVSLRYAITNGTDRTIFLVFPTTRMFAWRLLDQKGIVVYTYKDESMYTDVITTVIIPAHTSKTFTSTWHVPASISTGGYRFQISLLADGFPKTALTRAVLIKHVVPR